MFLWLSVKSRPGSPMINLLYSEGKNCEKDTARMYFVLFGNVAKGTWPVKEKGRTASLLHSIITSKYHLSLQQQDKAPKSYSVRKSVTRSCVSV